MRNIGLLFATLAALSACGSSADVKAAEGGVARFHAMLDAQKYSEIYRQSTLDIRGTMPEPRFVEFLAAIHRKLGPVGNAQQQGFNVQFGTSGHTTTLQYRTQFARGPAQETFVFRSGGGKVLLAGYNINSASLIVN